MARTKTLDHITGVARGEKPRGRPPAALAARPLRPDLGVGAPACPDEGRASRLSLVCPPPVWRATSPTLSEAHNGPSSGNFP